MALTPAQRRALIARLDAMLTACLARRDELRELWATVMVEDNAREYEAHPLVIEQRDGIRATARALDAHEATIRRWLEDLHAGLSVDEALIDLVARFSGSERN